MCLSLSCAQPTSSSSSLSLCLQQIKVLLKRMKTPRNYPDHHKASLDPYISYMELGSVHHMYVEYLQYKEQHTFSYLL